ncbi:hypothetical protein [Antarctobacter sp.]|uniref:hypothetical protein n=1 Tax=Antarctobacter sp. TaxID=1872577 RepID=UPI003A93C74C
MPFLNYEFSAYRESDLTLNGRSNFFVGDTIIIPGTTTVSITINDDDGFLSGDNISNENADDTSGQTAAILNADGDEIGSGGQVYGEAFYWVSDASGNQYALVEIEQEDGGGDFFAFVSDYGIPEAGTELHVESKVNIKNSTLIPEYQNLAGAPPAPEPEPEPEPDPEPQFVFTAFNEFDLTMAGKENLFVGDTIMLPSDPTLVISVEDDDAFLSGDNLVSEYADDETGQVAAVTRLDGVEVGNGGQIFGEAYYWVVDPNNNRFLMVEIEQEGSEDDYFAFHTDYGVPESGVELYVERKVNIKDNTLIPEYEGLTAGELPEGYVESTGDLFV